MLLAGTAMLCVKQPVGQRIIGGAVACCPVWIGTLWGRWRLVLSLEDGSLGRAGSCLPL